MFDDLIIISLTICGAIITIAMATRLFTKHNKRVEGIENRYFTPPMTRDTTTVSDKSVFEQHSKPQEEKPAPEQLPIIHPYTYSRHPIISGTVVGVSGRMILHSGACVGEDEER